jgi:hypothetical protein
MFFECKSVEEKKKLYRRLSKYLHPDCGGEGDLMALLTRSYESSISFSGFEPDDDDPEEEEWDGVVRHESSRVYNTSSKTILIDVIMAYAKDTPGFKIDFVKSIKDYLEKNGSISAKQYNCLVDLYYSRKIDEWATQKTKKKN